MDGGGEWNGCIRAGIVTGVYTLPTTGDDIKCFNLRLPDYEKLPLPTLPRASAPNIFLYLAAAAKI